MNIHELINMGGYGFYVWSAYSITLVVFGINLFITLHQKKQAKKTIQQFLTQLTKSQ